MTDLLQQDPWLAQMASRDNRLFLKRSVGPYSAGTQVIIVQENTKTHTYFIRQRSRPNPGTSEVVECTIDDLVIRRKRN